MKACSPLSKQKGTLPLDFQSLRALYHEQNKDYDKAIESWAMEEANPEVSVFGLAIAGLYEKQGREKEAGKQAHRGPTLFPDDTGKSGDHGPSSSGRMATMQEPT